MDDFSKIVLAKCISQKANLKPTAFCNLNECLEGGLPEGRLIEIYGRSQIGKSSLALSLFPDETVLYLDLARKLCIDYKPSNIMLAPLLNNQEAFDFMLEVIHSDIYCVIDDLTMLGTIRDDSERFRWLMRNFMILQRELVETKSIIVVLNQIRMSPSTGRSYNPHEGCLDAAVKIKMHFAEHKTDGELVYLDIEKHYWGQEGARCTLLVSKNKVTVPEFYTPKPVQTQECPL